MFTHLVALFSLVTVFGIPAISAQQARVASTDSRPTQTAQLEANPMARRLNIDLTNVTLKFALDEIVKQSGVRMLYDFTIVPVDKRVSIRGSDITLGSALNQVLKGTQVKARADEDRIVIERATLAKAVVKGQGVIVGTVRDAKTNKGISGANVSVGNDTRGSTTSEDGSYRLTEIAPGTHTVAVRLVGYAKQSRAVVVGEGATVTVDFKLETSANVLDQVIVTGTVVQTELKAVPNAITVITAKQIEERGITRIDQLFRGDIPGLFALNTGSNAPLNEVVMFSRGATALSGVSAGVSSIGNTNPIKTYVDGVELADPKYLSQIDPKSIERIEILTGPQASTIYGSNAINGVMQIFTKRGTATHPQVSVSLLSGWVENNFSAARTPQHDYSAQVSGVEGRLSYNTGGSWNYMGPWTPAKQTTQIGSFGGIRLEQPLTIGRITADVALRRTTIRNQAHGSQLQGSTGYVETGWYNVSHAVGLAIPQTNTRTGQTLGLTLRYAPTNWWSHELGLGQDFADSELRYTARGYLTVSDTTLRLTQIHIYRRSRHYVTTAQVPVTSFVRATTTIGADMWQNMTSSVQIFPQTLVGSLIGSTSIGRQPGHNTGGFLQTQLGISDRLFFTYGLRAEWNPDFGKDAQPNYAPRYGVAYTQDLGPITTKLRGSYGRSTRPPQVGLKREQQNTDANLSAVYGVYNSLLANPELGPEYQQGGEGGLEVYLGGRAAFVITRYNQTVDALIASAPVDSVRSLVSNPTIIGLTCAQLIQFGLSSYCSGQDAAGFGYVPQLQSLNLGSIRNQGWELQGSLHAGPITTRGTYSWTKSRTIGIAPTYRTFFTPSSYPQYQPGATFQYLPEHTWALGVTYAYTTTIMALNLTGTGRLVNARDNFYLRNLSAGVRLPQYRLNMDQLRYTNSSSGYVLADLTTTHQFSSALQGMLQIQNLTDRYSNNLSADYSTIGRQIKTGLRVLVR